MTTELKRFAEAYATMTIAVYEPLIVRWLSALSIWHIADTIAQRAVPTKLAPRTRSLMTSHAVATPRRMPADPVKYFKDRGLDLERLASSQVGSLNADTLRSLIGNGLEGFPSLEVTDNTVFFEGRMSVTDGVNGASTGSEPALPILFSPTSAMRRPDVDGNTVRDRVMKGLNDVLTKAARQRDIVPGSELRKRVLTQAAIDLKDMDFEHGLEFMPVQGEYHEMLSPIGIAHFYRQLYFHLSEGVGPVEQAFTVAPAETLEVVYETVRRQIHEDITEVGSETVSETAVESKNVDEISDKVASMIQRDTSAAMSANATFGASGSIGVWQAGASATMGANASMAQSTQRSNELASRRLKETTKRASERITKSFSLRVRDVEDVTTTNLTRRMIKNQSDKPVSYGLRRVFNRINVKVQNLGPYLVWQLYIRDPGRGLARSRFVHFLDAQPVSHPSDPPAIRPRPTGGTDTGTTSTTMLWSTAKQHAYVVLAIRTASDRTVTAVSIDSITDLEGGGKEDLAPSARNDVQWDQTYNTTTRTFTVKIGVLPGDAASISVNYTYVYEPSEEVVAAWEAEKAQAEAKLKQAEAEEREKALREQFERDKALITEKSKIRPRPANDLRREERYEVMNRMVSHLFARDGNSSTPSPLEIEYFHAYFDMEAMFVYTHPSWWVPRYAPAKTGLQRPAYEITAESEPAPMGRSLGWVIQLDGDTRRNEFINSPWVRVCLPIRANREREAIAWLAAHIEGEIGYNPSADPLKGLLSDIAKLRGKQELLGINGPDYVTVASTVGAPNDPARPEHVYPIIDEFEATVPTEGFVYDELKVVIP